jgi:Cu/Ag efflux pump CusA
LAVVILGGLISSTILNVFVVPVLYRFITLRYHNNIDKDSLSENITSDEK